MCGPIRPDEVGAQQHYDLPKEVFEVFNQLIARAWNGLRAVVSQEEVISLLEERDFSRAQVLDGGLLDEVRRAYRDRGWVVSYDASTARYLFRS